MKIIIDEEELAEIIADHVGKKIDRQLGTESVKIETCDQIFGFKGDVIITVEID